MNERDIFTAALQKPDGPDRSAFLEEACGGDAGLRRQIDALFCEHELLGSFLEVPDPVLSATIAHPGREWLGTVLGPYKLLEQIGEGGFGLVFMAEQQQPVRRKVAVKVLKPGMDTHQVIARFEAERQALALMDHPNIARVLEAGATPGEPGGLHAGRPYVVMELLRGAPITDYCDQNCLTTQERLELFATVCKAVQHAHQKGIIHRDIKPSNVMVTLHDGAPVVKVIDFGIAKAVGQQLTDKTLLTAFAQIIGTPLYMSPEQAQGGLDVDTRTDIYSLGLLLYELLTGTTPFDKERLHGAGYDEMRRIIREEEPAKPSTRVNTLGKAATTVSARRKSDPKRLSQLFRGELDWIVMKALEKDRNRRYETASALAADVERYLHDKPVSAAPPSGWYRFRKFARRHKAGLRIALATALASLLAVGGVSWALWDQASRRTELSERLAETERTVNAALIRTEQWRKQAVEAPSATSQEANAVMALWGQTDASLAQAETALKTGTADARLRQRVLDERQQIGEQQARARRTANLLRDLDDARMTCSTWIDTHFDYAGASTKYAAAFAAYGLEVKPGRTEELARRIRAEQPAIREALIVALDDWRLNALLAKTRFEERILVREIAAAADDDPWRQELRAGPSADEHLALRALSGEARRLSLPPPSLLLLAWTLHNRGERAEALTLLRWARVRYPGDFWVHFELGSLLDASEDRTGLEIEEAIGCYTTALALRPEASAAYTNLGIDLLATNQAEALDAAIYAFQQALTIDPKLTMAHYYLGNALTAKNRWDDAVAEYRKAIALDPQYAVAHNNLGLALKANNQLDDAIAEFRQAVALNPTLLQAHGNLGLALKAKNQWDEAVAECKKAVELNPKLASVHDCLGLVLKAKNQWNEAVAEYRRAIELDANYVPAHCNLGNALAARNQWDEAMAEYRKAIALDPQCAPAHYSLGGAFRAKNQWDEAVAEYRRVIELQSDFYAEAHCNLANILRSRGQLSASLDFYKRGHSLGSRRNDWGYPSAQWVAEAERLVAWEAKLPDILAGKAKPTDNRELLGLLEVCRLQRRYVATARLYADAFSADPKLADDLNACHRYKAACSAALAAAGQGTDADKLDNPERSRLRQQALAWLRADTDLWRKGLEGAQPARRQAMRQMLQLWQRDADLAGVRDAASPQKLSAEEQEAWRKLWTDVAELLKKAGDTE